MGTRKNFRTLNKVASSMEMAFPRSYFCTWANPQPIHYNWLRVLAGLQGIRSLGDLLLRP